jgi:hypothetical protein
MNAPAIFGRRSLLALLLACACAASPCLAAAPPAPAAAPPAGGTTSGGGGSGSQDEVFNVILVPQGSRAPAVAPRGAAAGAPGKARPETGAGGASSLLWLLPVALVVVLLALRLGWRRRPRRCAECGAGLRRLDREATYAALDMAERTEHLIGDVTYEVWRCPACGRIEKRGVARDSTALAAAAPPVGSAAFLRRYGQSGLSIWSPKSGAGAKPTTPGTSSPHRILPPPR